MKEREFKKLVFENFVQAKKELIREGYLKRTDNLNFEDVFSETKKKVLEEKVKSLQRENQMLKSKLSQRRGLKEAGTMSAAGMGKQGGLDWFNKTFRDVSSMPKDKLAKVAIKLGINLKGREFSRLNAMLNDSIESGKLNSPEKIEKAIRLVDNLDNLNPSNYEFALESGINKIAGIDEPKSEPQTLSESRRRRRY